LERVAKSDYVPTRQDVRGVREKSTGVNEIEFKIGNYLFSMTDVGGQRSERRKWIHCFENVTAIIFCSALSEYDQKLYDDETTNRMYEALRLFSDITNSKWFNETPVILFLNKKDIFEAKIKKVPLNVCFKEYTGPNEYEPASQFIETQFLQTIKNTQKLVYVYKTCATDTNNVKFIFKAVKDVFITVYLQQMGLLGGPSMGMGGGGGVGTMPRQEARSSQQQLQQSPSSTAPGNDSRKSSNAASQSDMSTASQQSSAPSSPQVKEIPVGSGDNSSGNTSTANYKDAKGSSADEKSAEGHGRTSSKPSKPKHHHKKKHKKHQQDDSSSPAEEKKQPVPEKEKEESDQSSDGAED